MSSFGMKTSEYENELGGTRTEIRRLDEVRKYYHRVVVGVLKKEMILYPSYRTDNETGEVSQLLIPIDLDPNADTVLDELGRIERRIRKELGAEDKTMFNRTTRYLFMVFDRDDHEVKLVPYEYPYTVVKNLMKLQKERSRKDPTKLLNGSIYAWDAIIEKSKDPKISDPRYSIGYSASVDTETAELSGQMPAEVIELDDYDDSEWVKKALTEEEYEALLSWQKEHPNGLLDYVERNTNTGVRERLERFPVNPAYVNKQNVLELSVASHGTNEPFVEEFIKQALSIVDADLIANPNKIEITDGTQNSWDEKVENAEEAVFDETSEKDTSDEKDTSETTTQESPEESPEKELSESKGW